MRDLSSEEFNHVSGGFNAPGALGAIYLGWEIGWQTGTTVNRMTQAAYGSTLGEAIYYLSH